MATKADIECWIYDAPKEASHMAVVCDSDDHYSYPVYIEKGKSAFKETEKYRVGEDMPKLMEVYDLDMEIEAQLNEQRAFHF